MRIVQVAVGLVATLALASCEPDVTGPASDALSDVPAPSFDVLNPVVEQVMGSAVFQRTAGDQTYLHRAAFTARRYADGTVDGMYHSVGRQGPNWSRVYCFTVEGNQAWLGLIVERSQNAPPAPGDERAVYVVDNGEGIHAPPDRSTAFPPLGTTLLGDPPEGYDEWTLDLYCAETPEIPARSVFALAAGNVQIYP